MDSWSIALCEKCPCLELLWSECGKIHTGTTPNTDTFQAVLHIHDALHNSQTIKYSTVQKMYAINFRKNKLFCNGKRTKRNIVCDFQIRGNYYCNYRYIHQSWCFWRNHVPEIPKTSHLIQTVSLLLECKNGQFCDWQA